MFPLRFLLFHMEFRVFENGYRVIIWQCFFIVSKSVMKYEKTAVN